MDLILKIEIYILVSLMVINYTTDIIDYINTKKYIKEQNRVFNLVKKKVEEDLLNDGINFIDIEEDYRIGEKGNDVYFIGKFTDKNGLRMQVYKEYTRDYILFNDYIENL